jgi:polysaccharide export outer membrane protein
MIIWSMLALAALGVQAPPPAAAPPVAAPAPTVGSGNTGQGYRIGSGDILRIAVFGHDDLSQTVVVQPDGTVVFPLIGSVPVAEATPREVEARIASRLSKGLIRDAQVSVLVQEYRSKVVYVVGEVMRPGTYPLAGDVRLVEVLARAGPLSPSAGTEVVVVRPQGPIDRPVLPTEVTAAANGAAGSTAGAQAKVLKVDITQIQGGNLAQNIALRANDTVFVPQAARIFVTGEVRNPGAFPFSAGITARQAVSLAGGFNEDASKGKAQVVRTVDGRPRPVKIQLDDALRPGDTVLIKAKLF